MSKWVEWQECHFPAKGQHAWDHSFEVGHDSVPNEAQGFSTVPANITTDLLPLCMVDPITNSDITHYSQAQTNYATFTVETVIAYEQHRVTYKVMQQQSFTSSVCESIKAD